MKMKRKMKSKDWINKNKKNKKYRRARPTF